VTGAVSWRPRSDRQVRVCLTSNKSRRERASFSAQRVLHAAKGMEQRLIPPTAAIDASAGKQDNQKHYDKQRGGTHLKLPIVV
jgi:hypothetical protein